MKSCDKSYELDSYMRKTFLSRKGRGEVKKKRRNYLEMNQL